MTHQDSSLVCLLPLNSHLSCGGRLVMLQGLLPSCYCGKLNTRHAILEFQETNRMLETKQATFPTEDSKICRNGLQSRKKNTKWARQFLLLRLEANMRMMARWQDSGNMCGLVTFRLPSRWKGFQDCNLQKAFTKSYPKLSGQ